jgi:hypothetical protein
VSNQFGVPNQTDVFAIANNGGLHVCWVVGAGNWNGPVQISPSRHFAPGAPLAVSNQFGSPNQTDVFGFAENRALHVAWVFGADAWNGPVQIAPPVYPVITITVWGDLGRFVEVSGRWFTPNAAVTLDYNIQGNSPLDLIGTHTVMSNAEGHFVHAIPITFPDDIQWIAVDARDLASGAAGNVYFG